MRLLEQYALDNPALLQVAVPAVCIQAASAAGMVQSASAEQAGVGHVPVTQAPEEHILPEAHGGQLSEVDTVVCKQLPDALHCFCQYPVHW